MPSAALQSRILTFESFSSADPLSSSSSTLTNSAPRKSQFNGPLLEAPFSPPITPRQSTSTSPSPSPPDLGHKTSFVDLKDWIVDDGPSPPRTNSFKSLYVHTNGNSSANGHGQRAAGTNLITPLINLETSPKPHPKLKPFTVNSTAPPLPPRKPSFPSLKSATSYASLTSNNERTPPNRSDSLTVAPLHTYPPLKIDPSRPRNTLGHAPASSISSFHSVSLSSDTDPSTPGSVTNFIATYPVDQGREREFSMKSNSSEGDSISLGESYEEVSIPSLGSPNTERVITRDWEKAMVGRVPPKLPKRPASSSSASHKPPTKPPPLSVHQASNSASYLPRPSISALSLPSAGPSIGKRRPPPPPPSRSSDRSSIQSTSTSRSTSSTYSKIDHPWTVTSLHAKTKRPTPVPPAARHRYESVFNENVVQGRRAEKQKGKDKLALLSPTEARGARRAAGWRGLSVDLITGDRNAEASSSHKEDSEEVDEAVGCSDRLEGCFVKSIWVKSKLDREKLNEIWTECDTTKTGTLDRDEFVNGMWRIDEELRRVRAQAVKSVSVSSLTSLRGSSGHKLPSHKSKHILR